MYVYPLLYFCLKPAEHTLEVFSLLTRLHIFFHQWRGGKFTFSALSYFLSLSRSPSLPLLSLSCTLLFSPKSKRAVVSPFCLPHLWCSMGRWLYNDRQAECRAVHEAKREQTSPLKWKTKLESVASPSLREILLCWEKVCSSVSRSAPGSSHPCKCVTCCVIHRRDARW